MDCAWKSLLQLLGTNLDTQAPGVVLRSMVYNLTAELFAEWAIGIIVAGIRIYSRCFVDKRGLYWDDAFLILGLVRFLHCCPSSPSRSPDAARIDILDFDDHHALSLHRYTLSGTIAIMYYGLHSFSHLDVYGSNIGLTSETALDIPDNEVPSYTIGSVCGFVAWIAYIVAVWAFKGVLVFLCTRLT